MRHTVKHTLFLEVKGGELKTEEEIGIHERVVSEGCKLTVE